MKSSRCILARPLSVPLPFPASSHDEPFWPCPRTVRTHVDRILSVKTPPSQRRFFFPAALSFCGLILYLLFGTQNAFGVTTPHSCCPETCHHCYPSANSHFGLPELLHWLHIHQSLLSLLNIFHLMFFTGPLWHHLKNMKTHSLSHSNLQLHSILLLPSLAGTFILPYSIRFSSSSKTNLAALDTSSASSA